jgi:hypothetical protein
VAASVFSNGKGVANSGAVVFKRARGRDVLAAFEPLPPERSSSVLLYQIRAAGFDHIPLMTTAEPPLTDDGAALARATAWLIKQVDEEKAPGLGVVLDVHPWTSGDSLFHQDGIMGDPGRREARMRALVVPARHFAKKDGVALEVLDEPPCFVNKAEFDWARAQNEMVIRIRCVAPMLPLVLKGCRDRIDSLVALDARNYTVNPNIYCSFHSYQPSAFVEQSQKELYDVPFPPNPAPANSLLAMRKMAPASTAPSNRRAVVELNEYLRDGKGRASIASDFDKLLSRARPNGVPVSLIRMGAWGNIIERGQRTETIRPDQLRWLVAMHQEAERRGFT